MKKTMKKALSVVLSFTMIFTSVTWYGDTKVEAADASIISSATTNVALGKSVTAFPGIAEGDITYVTDGALTKGGNHAALSSAWGYTGESYAVIDLGDYYDASTIDEVVVQYKDRANNDTVVDRSYKIQYSANGIDYSDVIAEKNVVETDLDADNCITDDVTAATGTVRFVKVDYPTTPQYGIQICEIAVLDTNNDLAKVEVERCANPDSVTVSSTKKGIIDFTITPGEGQEGYKYVAYLDDKAVPALTDLDGNKEYSIEKVESGTHTVKIVSVFDGKDSTGLVSDSVQVKTIVDDLTNPAINLAYAQTFTFDCGKSAEHEGSLTDGIIKTEYSTTSKGKENSWATIELGKAYAAGGVDSVCVWFRSNTGGTYPGSGGIQVQYSTDGVSFSTVASLEQTDLDKQFTDQGKVAPMCATIDVSAVDKPVKFVRINYPSAITYGAQMSEIAVLDTDSNATEYEVPTCADAASVSVVSNDYNELTYNITAGPDQEGFVYKALLDGTQEIGSGLDAGKDYTVKGISSGVHFVTIIAANEGAVSKGITSANVNVKDITSLIYNIKNVANSSNYPGVKIASVSSFKDSSFSLETAKSIVDGNLEHGEDATKGIMFGKGAPQDFVVDLGKYYEPTQFAKAVLGCHNADTYPTSVKIEFSRDGVNYTQVGDNEGYTLVTRDDNLAPINSFDLNKVTDYKEEAVRFVKVSLIDGHSNYGFVINEFGLTVDTDEPKVVTPDVTNPADLILASPELGRFTYTVVAGENQEEGYTYSVSMDGKVINDNAIPGTEYTYPDGSLTGGTYKVTVTASHNGWVSDGIEKSVLVDGYENHIKDSLNIAYSGAHPDVQVYMDPSEYFVGEYNGDGGVSAKPECLNNGIYNDSNHHGGYIQTNADQKEATIIYTFDREYNATDIHSVISSYLAENNAATEYIISFSSDGENYEEIYHGKDVKWQMLINDVVDMGKYTQGTVKYMKYEIKDGNIGPTDGWLIGYNLCEIAVMGDISLLPAKATNVTATSPEFNMLKISWEDITDADAKYSVYLDGILLDPNIAAGVQEKTYRGITEGTHKVEIGVTKNGITSKSDPVSVLVKTETTTPAPTTKAPVTTKEPTTTTKAIVTTTKKPQTITKPALKTLGKVTKVKAKNNKKRSLKISWKKVSKAKKYQIKVGTKTYKTSKTTYTVKGLKKKKTYKITVRAMKYTGYKQGAWSKAIKVKIKK